MKTAAEINAIVEAYASGRTAKDIGAEYGISPECVFYHLRCRNAPCRSAAKTRVQRQRITIGPREHQMAAMYGNGKTLREIGAEFGITRERVRQILRLMNGPTSREGGPTRVLRQRAAARKAAREAACLEKHGCSLSQYKWLAALSRRSRSESNGPGPLPAYRSQKKSARIRGIEWRMTLWEWWSVWQGSGRWNERGLRKGQYVMARYGDEGPYSPDNVKIIQSSENVSEGYLHRAARKAAA